MNNEEKWQSSELIPLLIKYKQTIGVIFPIGKVKHLLNEIVIERIKKCISENKMYEPHLNNLNDIQLLSDFDLKRVVPLVIETMESINYDYKADVSEILNLIELRKKGKKFSFDEHLKALVISLLSNHRWGDSNIRENIDKIDNIFHNYDKNYLKVVDYKILVSELRKIHCTNPMIRKQMESLSKNILVLEKIEKEYESLDTFVTTVLPNDIANLFYAGKYKLIQVGRSFTFDYLKRVGINTCKTSRQLERLFGYTRLAIVENENATGGQVLSIIKKLAEMNSLTEIEVESILLQFCLLRSANICGETPKCEKCKLRDLCNYDK
jgi:hypothetical protein